MGHLGIMSKDTKNNKSQNSGKKANTRKFRMAYSLNNWQPVQCTIVSDQPFFYMDEEHNLDDDAILADEFTEDYDLISDENLLAEITSMKKKMDAYECLSNKHVKKEDQRLNEFIFDSEIFLTKQKTLNKNTLKQVIEILIKSRMGEHLLEFAVSKNINIEFSKQIETAFYDKSAATIFIRPDLEITDQVLLLVQELRHFWQDSHGACINPLSLHPDQAVLINRAQKADLAVAIVRCAWEMKLQGAQEIWTRIENSSMSDLGRALAREALSDFRSLNNGKASSAVFETWFLSERCRNEDKALIQSMLADYRGYVFNSDNMQPQISIELICKLGEQPFGKNYLASYAHVIPNDTLFTEVRDRSNANFLWFIKFEQTFQETEQELQSSELIKMAGVDQSENKNIFEDNQNENRFKQSAEKQSRCGNNVIHVPFGQMGQAASKL